VDKEEVMAKRRGKKFRGLSFLKNIIRQKGSER